MKLIISVNIIEAKLFFVLMGFEPWTSGSAVQYPNHWTTEAYNIPVSHYKYDIGVKYCICKDWLSTCHYYNILYADYDLSNGSRSKVTM